MSWKAKPSATTDPVSLDVAVRAERARPDAPYLTDAQKARWTNDVLPRYADRMGALLPILHDVQHEYRCVPYAAMMEVATFLGIAPGDVLDTVSFYEEFHTQPVGRCVIGVCQSIACEVCGHQAIVDRIRARLDLEPHETDDEGRYTLLTLECLGSCDTAPVALFNGELAENLAVEQVETVLDELDAVPVEELDEKRVTEIVRRHCRTQEGRNAGAG